MMEYLANRYAFISAIFSDDGLDEFFGNGELSPTFFENEILLSPNAATVCLFKSFEPWLFDFNDFFSPFFKRN